VPKASKQTASEHETVEGYEGHFEHFEGGWTVAFETYTSDVDLAPLFKGLPDDRCQCAHMGYVLAGRAGRIPSLDAGRARWPPTQTYVRESTEIRGTILMLASRSRRVCASQRTSSDSHLASSVMLGAQTGRSLVRHGRRLSSQARGRLSEIAMRAR
jgi:hypothetical protein